MNEKTLRKRLGIEATEEWAYYTYPGGYPIIYITDDGEALCPKCMNMESEVHFGGVADGWRIENADVYWEGPTLQCAHCNAEIESAYGDPSEEEEVKE